MGPGEEFQAPPTTRLGPADGSGRRARLAVGLAVAALALAVAKPWSWLPASPGAAPPEAGASASGGPPPAAAATTPWTSLGGEPSCLSGRLWMAVVDEVDEGRPARSWTRLAPAAAGGPDDHAVVRTHAYAASVPRVGFCAPVAAALASGADPGERFAVRLWRIGAGAASEEPGEMPLVVVAGGTLADGGALYAAVAGPDRAGGQPGSWPPGTYVFRVQLPGAGPGGDAAAWFAIELRGPWTGPGGSPGGESPAPGSSPAPGESPAPDASPAPDGYSRRSP